MEVSQFQVLLIDDKQDNLLTLSAVLKVLFPKILILTALDGVTGLKMASLKIPDIILLDIVMPGMDGFEVCRQLKADPVLKDIPVIFLTAMETGEEARIQALEVGAEAFLSKPVNEAELAAQIRAMLKISLANKFQKQEKESLSKLVAERTLELERELTEHRKTLTAKRENEDLFHKIFQANPEAISISRLSDGQFLEVNSAYCKITGFSREVLIGHTADELNMFLNPEQKLKIEELSNSRTKVSSDEFAFRNKAGDLRTWSISTEFITFINEACLLQVGRDISDRIKVEEEQFISAAAFNSIHDCVIIMGTDFIVKHWNANCVKLFGVETDQAVGKMIGDLLEMMEDSPGQNLERLKLLDELGSNQEEQRYRTPKGEIWVDVHVQAIERQGKRIGWVTLLMDITERKKAEKALELNRQTLFKLSEQVPGVIYQYRLYPDGHSCFPYSSSGMKDIYEFTSEEVRQDATPVFGRLHPDDSKQVSDAIFESARTLQHFHCEFRVILPRQGLRWRHSDATPERLEDNSTLWHGIIYDITERKRADEALRESVIFSSELLNNTPYPMFVADEDSSIRLVNPAFEALTGFSNQELTGVKAPYPWWPEESKVELTQIASKERATSGFFTNFERHYKKKNGEPMWIVLNTRKVDSGHSPVFYVAAWQDITDRKKAEIKLDQSYQTEKHMREELQEEAKARGMFIEILGHELRTPLTPITACSGMLQEILNAQDRGIEKSLIGNICKGTDSLARRLEELLDLAKFSRGSFKLQKQPVDVINLVSNVVKQYQTLAEQQLKRLVFEIEGSLPEIVADSARMEQVLVNLVSNALKYSPENTSITLKVKKTDSDLIIEVQDQGIGVTPEEQQQIFSPYHRVVQDTQKYPGIGLGLAISKQIVEAHGGKIRVESELAKGSTFIIQMPLTKAIKI